MTAPILITGATGNVGSEIARQLISEQQPIRLADFDLTRLHKRFGPDVDSVEFDFARPKTYPAAFEGVERIFLMRPPQIADVKKKMFPAIATARAAGVRHVVFLSLIGIETNRRVPHYAVETCLRSSGMDWTFLRASFFMQNLATTHRNEIRLRSEIDVPVGRGRTAFIDVRDIAAVAVRALTEPGHENQAYDLTGGEALNYYEVARLFSEGLARSIGYRNPSVPGFLLRQIRSGTPLHFALIMVMLYESTRRGMAETVTGEVQRLLGRPPISLRQFIQDYRNCWL